MLWRLEQLADREPINGEQARKRLLYARLITLMQLANESAAIGYPRRLHMPDLNRQLIFMIGMYGAVASKDIAAASGRQKAQISRGVKSLTEDGLVDRTEPRGAISLSAAGRSIYMDVLKVARERDYLLRKDLSNGEVARFLEMTADLIDRASSIFLADERSGAINLEERSSLYHPPEPRADLPRTSLEEPSYRDLILPWLQSLMTYLRRSGTILFRREVNLSQFEWWILSLIEENQPINLSSLIVLVGRDKSQVARVIKQLHAEGLVSRRDEGRVNAALALTSAGHARYEKIFAISVERDGVLFAGHRADDRAFYVDVLDRLTFNADEMLHEERMARSEQALDPKRPRSEAIQPRDETDGTVSPPSRVELDHLHQENARLKKLLAEAILENAMLKERGVFDA